MPRLSVAAMLWACTQAPPTGPGGQTGDTAQAGTEDTAAPVELSVTSVSLHPDQGSMPVVAWDQALSGIAQVEYRFDSDWQRTPPRELGPGSYEQLVVGVPFDSLVELRVVLDDGELVHQSDATTLATDPVDPGLPGFFLQRADPERLDPTVQYVLLSATAIGGDIGGPYFTVIVDRQGRVLWSRETSDDLVTWAAQVSANGRELLVDHNSFWRDFDAELSEVWRMKLDGSVIEVLDTPGMAHAFTELPDGNLVWVWDEPGVGQLVQRHPDGSIERIWACGDHVAVHGGTKGCGTNSVVYDEARDSFLITSWGAESVFEIDRHSRQLVRTFGHLGDAWAFDPVESTFWWPHGAHYLPDGGLLVSCQVADGEDELVVREYRLDDKEDTLVEQWSFGTGEGIEAESLGDAHRLASGNTLHNMGAAGRLREITLAGEVVWELRLGTDKTYLGHTTPLSDLYALLPEP